jgi:methyl-accepting chemotaxis protein
MQTIHILLVILVVITAAIILGYYFMQRRKGEQVEIPYIIAIGVFMLICAGLFLYFQSVWAKKAKHDQEVFNTKIQQMENERAKEKDAYEKTIADIKKTYEKELALLEWKNRIFSSNKEMENELVKAKNTYQLDAKEVYMWRGLAENNTVEKLIPKDNTKEVLKEYQTRLKKSLNSVRSGSGLMNADIRMLADNINAIRLIGKEYEKVLGSFRELYDNIIASNNSGVPMQPPKQKKFLFFNVKQKEYEELLKQYYENQGNTKAVGQIAEQLKVTIEAAEEEFQAINRRFEQNLSFLQNTSDGITYNADKLENLIEAALNEANIISETSTQTDKTIKVQPTQRSKG